MVVQVKDAEVTPSMAKTPAAVDLHEFRLSTDVEYFSQKCFGVPYESVKAVIYPNPPYRTFYIRKRNAAIRTIQEPRKRLKLLQLMALKFIESRAAPPKPCVQGFVNDRSIVTNAKRHLETRPHHLLNLDLEDFFPSITFFRVRGVFKKAPFHLSHEVATVLAQLCTYQNALPQGAPTSPMVSNLVCRSLDRDLMALARRHRTTYTRYADDITFSFSVRDPRRLPQSICTYESGAVTLGHELIAEIESRHHFRINASKTRMSGRQSRMEVTGIKINAFPNIKRDFIDRVRGALRAWESHGYTAAQAAWSVRVAEGREKPYEQRPWRRQTRGGGTPELKNILWGKLLYIRMVRGTDDSIYTKLAERYNALRSRELAADGSFRCSSLPVERIVRNAQDAERSTFVLEWTADYLAPGSTRTEMVGSQGTAFSYERPEQLISCDHVLCCDLPLDGASFSVDCQDPGIRNLSLQAINPSTGDRWPVTVTRRDAGRDLAVLEIVGSSHNHRYFVGLDAPVHRNESGVLIGYPNWTRGRGCNQDRATVQNRYPRSALERFEISRLIRQGSSGGPFVGAQYRVAGVAQQGATQSSGNDECLCVTELDRWLETAASP
jgi:RNA-directed DNA polymerase